MKSIARITLLASLSVLVGCSDGTVDPIDNVPGSLSFTVVSGDGQDGEAGEELPNPLVVEVTETKNGKTKPLADYLVNFVVTKGGGSVFAGAAVTTQEGIAMDYWTLGDEGCDPFEECLNTLEVRAVDHVTGEKLTFATFSATALPPVARIALWGSTGLMYKGSALFRAAIGDNLGGTDDYVLARNILAQLSGKTSDVDILYTRSCDPRTSPTYCGITSNWAYLQPFFDTIGPLGTITFSTLSSANPADYDVLIADFCSSLLSSSSERDLLASYLSQGGAALVLADRFCGTSVGDLRYSAEYANLVLADYGIQFGETEVVSRYRLPIPVDQQTGLLSGVAEVGLWRLTPVNIVGDFVPVISWLGNALVVVHAGLVPETGSYASSTPKAALLGQRLDPIDFPLSAEAHQTFVERDATRQSVEVRGRYD